MSESGHPARFGFKQCAVCGTWQREENTKRYSMPAAAPPGLYLAPPPEEVDICKDTAWCVVLHWQHLTKSHGPGTGPVPVSMCGRSEVYFARYSDNITCKTCKEAFVAASKQMGEWLGAGGNFAAPSTAAVKHDAGKPRVELVSEVALLGLAEVLTFGAETYSADNWRKGMEWRRLIGSAFRHLLDFSMGVDMDRDSGLPSIDHLACCVMFLSEYQKRKLGTDNRWKQPESSTQSESSTISSEETKLRDHLKRVTALGYSFSVNTREHGAGWSWRKKGEESTAFPTLQAALDDAEADANSA